MADTMALKLSLLALLLLGCDSVSPTYPASLEITADTSIHRGIISVTVDDRTAVLYSGDHLCLVWRALGPSTIAVHFVSEGWTPGFVTIPWNPAPPNNNLRLLWTRFLDSNGWLYYDYSNDFCRLSQ